MAAMGRASSDEGPHPGDSPAADSAGDGQVVIGLGGNLGEVMTQFCAVVVQLDLMYTVRAVSALYRTLPLGPPQPSFLNAAVLIDRALDLHLLLNQLHQLEAAAGRERGERWGARTLDLDVLWAGSNVVRDSALTVPHPALRERRFALLPLLDLVPDATDPTDGVRYATLVHDVETQGVEVLARDEWWRRAM